VVSKGPERYAVPKLVGTQANTAGSALEAEHLSLGAAEQAWSETVPTGVVISQQPEAGTSVKPGAVVRIAVSKGRAPIKVPDVRNKTLDEATRLLTEAGLTVKRAPDDVNSDTAPVGSVASQTPDKGTLFRGDAVTLTISKGPILVKVPRVIGQELAKAEPALTALGFKVKVERPLGRFFELVRQQSLEPNSMAPKGSVIVLVVV
jgi:serine/threonine-protein kinase